MSITSVILQLPFVLKNLATSQGKRLVLKLFLLTLQWITICLQCFGAVGWAAGRASSL